MSRCGKMIIVALVVQPQRFQITGRCARSTSTLHTINPACDDRAMRVIACSGMIVGDCESLDVFRNSVNWKVWDSLTHALKDKPKKLLALIGLTRAEFDDLLVAFTMVSQPNPNLTQQGQPCQRKVGGGRKATLPLAEDRLLFIVVYMKTYLLQEIMVELFELDVSNVNEWIHRLLPLLRDAHAVAQTQAQCPTGQTVIVAGTERRRQRPKKPEKQVLHYSGKKKAHTDKNLVIAERKTRRVTYLCPTYPSVAHDKKIAGHEQIQYAPKTILYKDTGF